MPPPSHNLSLSITNPLVLYRSLVATKKIKPDPAQHRLALQLQKLYFRLKDYSPEIEYRYRLARISRSLSRQAATSSGPEQQDATEQVRKGKGSVAPSPRPGFSLRSLLNVLPASTLALTTTQPLHQSALNIDSPLGLLLYGEVGRGKSMLVDLLYTSLPSRKKRRWHFNAFMLDIFRRLELERIARLDASNGGGEGGGSLFGPADLDNEHMVLSLAKDTITDSPILFLDEFQMPDRTSSKLLNGFLTAFFHLGGVLVASSNRMPEELSKASGVEFGSGIGLVKRGWGWGFRRSAGDLAQKGDFGVFVEVLRKRCEVWQMEGERDWRREDVDGDEVEEEGDHVSAPADEGNTEPMSTSTPTTTTSSPSADKPPHYHISIPSATASAFSADLAALNPTGEWAPRTLSIYSRTVTLPTTTAQGVLLATFDSLCSTYLGPADYISLASTFHTVAVSDIPVLTTAKKNEARRFITLLDALYECKCRLLIQADAPPDGLFFPETRSRTGAANTRGRPLLNPGAEPSLSQRNPDDHAHRYDDEDEEDSITSESFSEMYQDASAPFRPNISSYTSSAASPAEIEYSVASPPLRSVLADEDADFGPTYGNGRAASSRYPDSNTSIAPPGFEELERRQGPDFTTRGIFSGEDERFAYKRARSRLWEMCGRRWWKQRDGEPETWWTPVGTDGRSWERTSYGDRRPGDSRGSERPYGNRTEKTGEEPPRFGPEHAWGVGEWGKGAGEWGKGVEAKQSNRPDGRRRGNCHK